MAIKDILQKSKEALDRALVEKKRNEDFVKSLGPAIVETLSPILETIAANSKLSKEELISVVSQIKIEVPKIEVPRADVEVKLPEMPKIEVPVANVSVDTSGIKESILEGFRALKQPSVKVPKPEVTVNVPQIKVPDLKWPDEEMPIKGWVQLMGTDLAHPLPVQLRDAQGNPLNLFENLTQIVSGGGGARIVKIGGFSSSAFGDIQDSDGRLKVILPSGSSGLTDTELRASAVPVIQVTGSVDSVNVLQWAGVGTGSGDERNSSTLKVMHVGDAGVSVSATQVGTWNVNVNGALNSVLATGVTLHDAADDGDAPLKVGGVAMSSNPAKVSDGDRTLFRGDLIGRQLVRPVQARELLTTAYATLTTGTATTLLASAASTFNDLIYLVGANNSDVAVTVNISPGSAEGTVLTLQIPANGTAGIACPVPMPQNTAANTWTADMGDITGTTVFLSALFSKEV